MGEGEGVAPATPAHVVALNALQRWYLGQQPKGDPSYLVAVRMGLAGEDPAALRQALVSAAIDLCEPEGRAHFLIEQMVVDLALQWAAAHATGDWTTASAADTALQLGVEALAMLRAGATPQAEIELLASLGDDPPAPG